MTADRIEKLRAALEHIKGMCEVSGHAILDEVFAYADDTLDEDEKARLCAPAEVVTQP